MVTLQQISYYPPPPPLPPQYEAETKRTIYEEKIKSKIETAKRNNKYWLLAAIFFGIFGMYDILLEYYSGKLFQLSEIPLGLLWLVLCFLYFYMYITKLNVKQLEKCLSPVNAMNFYKEQIKKMFFIPIVGIIIVFSCFGLFQNLVIQNRFLLLLVIIGIIMFIAGVRIFYFLIKIKECEKYI